MFCGLFVKVITDRSKVLGQVISPRHGMVCPVPTGPGKGCMCAQATSDFVQFIPVRTNRKTSVFDEFINCLDRTTHHSFLTICQKGSMLFEKGNNLCFN
jgi:hypothetical protein